MKTVCALQHVDAEYLGLMEDHLESRAIRFHYSRPFVPGGRVPQDAHEYDGLILLGAGPLGVVSGPLLPSLAAELRLAEHFLKQRLPVIGIGLGAVILAVASGGGAAEEPLRFSVEMARRTAADALGGDMPERFPVAIYMRDRPVLPAGAQVLATGETSGPVVFQVGETGVGFLGHPGIKVAMVEDLIMASDDLPEGTAEGLAELRKVQPEIAQALTQIMVGLVGKTHWMSSAP